MQPTSEIHRNPDSASNARPEAPSDAPKPMFTDEQMRKLRFAVIGMGAVLLAGFALVIGRIVYLLNRPPVDASSSDPRAAATAPLRPSAPSALSTSAPASPARLALPVGAVVRHISLSGNRLAVQYEAPTGQGIQILDLATGHPVQHIDIVPEKPAPTR